MLIAFIVRSFLIIVLVVAVSACTQVFSVEPLATIACNGEEPEGPEWVNDVEHWSLFPGTKAVAPPWYAFFEQGVEWADYPACVKWCTAHPGQCGNFNPSKLEQVTGP